MPALCACIEAASGLECKDVVRHAIVLLLSPRQSRRWHAALSISPSTIAGSAAMDEHLHHRQTPAGTD